MSPGKRPIRPASGIDKLRLPIAHRPTPQTASSSPAKINVLPSDVIASLYQPRWITGSPPATDCQRQQLKYHFRLCMSVWVTLGGLMRVSGLFNHLFGDRSRHFVVVRKMRVE